MVWLTHFVYALLLTFPAAELLQNRAFQAVTPGTPAAFVTLHLPTPFTYSYPISSLEAWNSTTGTTLTVVNSTTGVSKALPNSLKVDVAAGASGRVGFLNTGYWGPYPSSPSFQPPF